MPILRGWLVVRVYPKVHDRIQFVPCELNTMATGDDATEPARQFRYPRFALQGFKGGLGLELSQNGACVSISLLSVSLKTSRQQFMAYVSVPFSGSGSRFNLNPIHQMPGLNT